MKLVLAKIFVILSVIVSFVFMSGSTWASEITVNTDVDASANDGVCSLREAILTAETRRSIYEDALDGECLPGEDEVYTVIVPQGRYLLNEELAIRTSMTIHGDGDALPVIDGQGLHRAFYLRQILHDDDADAELVVGVDQDREITIENIQITNTAGDSAIYSSGTFLTLNNVRFLLNHSRSATVYSWLGGSLTINGGDFRGNEGRGVLADGIDATINGPLRFLAQEGIAIYHNGRGDNALIVNNVNFRSNSSKAILARNIIEIRNSTFTKNQDVWGAAIEILNLAGNHSTALIDNSYFDQNTSVLDGVAGGAGAIYIGQTHEVLIRNSSFQGNTTQGYGGAIINAGETTIINSSFSGNWAKGTDGGAIANRGQLHITASTLVNNIAKRNGGAIKNFDEGSTTMRNSILVGNISEDVAANNTCSGEVISADYNLIKDLGDCNFHAANADAVMDHDIIAGVNNDEALDCSFAADLVANGSNPPLAAISEDTCSAAIDAGTCFLRDNNDEAYIPGDQRGYSRVERAVDGEIIIDSDHCDIGSYELDAEVNAAAVHEIRAAQDDNVDDEGNADQDPQDNPVDIQAPGIDPQDPAVDPQDPLGNNPNGGNNQAGGNGSSGGGGCSLTSQSGNPIGILMMLVCILPVVLLRVRRAY